MYEVARNANFPSPPPVEVNSLPDEFELCYDTPTSIQYQEEQPVIKQAEYNRGKRYQTEYDNESSKIETIEEMSETEYNFTEDDLDKIRHILRQNVKSNKSLKSLPAAKGQDLNRKNSSTTSGNH